MIRLGAIASIFLGLSVGCAQQQHTSPQQIAQVDSRKIGKEVEVIGPLGVPLGRIVNIEGHWVDEDFRRSKGQRGEKLFWVEKVNGIQLTAPVLDSLCYPSYQSGEPTDIPGKSLRALGYSDGWFDGLPDHESFKTVQHRLWHFHTVFRVIEIE